MRLVRRRALYAVAALALGTAAALVLLEGIARLAPVPSYHIEPLQLDPTLGFRGVPDHRETARDERGSFEIRFGAEGFRERDLPHGPAPPGERRLLFVGDSFLVGLGLRDGDLVPARVERTLRDEAAEAGRVGRALRDEAAGAGRARSVEVVNLGIVDTGTAQQLLLLRSLEDALGADTVVLFLYPSNDVINNWRGLAGRSEVSPGDYVRPYLVREDGELVRRPIHPLRSALRRHSALFAWIERGLLALGYRHRIDWLSPWPPRAGLLERLRAQRPPEEWMEVLRRPEPGSEWARAWTHTLDLVRTVRDLVEARGARFVVVVIPNRAQVERTGRLLALDMQTRQVAGVPLDRIVDWNRPEASLARFLRAERIEARLLLEPLRAAARSGGAPFTRDGHLSAEGHAVAAEALLPVLRAPSPTSERDRPAPLVLPDPAGLTGPADALPPAGAAAGPVSFEEAPHEALLGRGWGRWRRTREGSPGGWSLVGRGMLVLPFAEGGAFTLGGVRTGADARPLRLQVEIPGLPPRRFAVRANGPFRLRIPIPGSRRIPTLDDHVPVVLGPAGAVVFESPLLVQEAGFEPPAGVD